MLFLWFFHACRRGSPRFLMVADHVNYLTFEDPGAVNTVRRALKLAHAGDLHGAAETAGVDVGHAQVVCEGLQRGMRFSIGAEMDNDPRSRPDAQNIVEAMRPDGIIRSVNFVSIEHPEKGADWPWPFDNPEFAELHDVVGTQRLWELYIAKLLDDLEKLPSNVVGNFYAPANLGGWPQQERLEEYEDRLLTVCHARGLAVEINTRSLYREGSDEYKKRYLEANARLIRKAKALGVSIAIGSDAHSPRDQGNAFDSALQMLDDARINELVFPVAGRLARVALRATRENLEAEAKSRETNTPGSSITGFSRAELGLPEQAEVPAGRREARAARTTSGKKRDGGPVRAIKREEPGTKTAPRTSRRAADSSTSSHKAKEARTDKPADAPKKAAVKKVPAQKIAAKSAAKTSVKAPQTAKAAKKTGPARKPAGAKSAAAKKGQPAKKSVRRPTAARAASKKAPAKKTPAKKTTVKKPVAKKTAIKKPAPKAAAKSKSSAKKKSATKRR